MKMCREWERGGEALNVAMREKGDISRGKGRAVCVRNEKRVQSEGRGWAGALEVYCRPVLVS
jgi:hypothetical protein